ncbi:MAG: hypothetical protein C0423_12515 [Methylibium sp.]|nr:hypothetical protein [Methylibium sp.]
MTPDLPTQRLFFLDWLRILAFALLLPYHVGMYYVTWDWHIKSPSLHPGLEPLMMLSSPWRLGLLFLVAGAASQGLMQRLHGRGFLRSRTVRLLGPLLFGMLVIVPPQAYFEVVSKLHYEVSYLDFMQLYLQGYGGFCQEQRCLKLPTWNHLWFLPYLWVYSVFGYLLLKAWPGAPAVWQHWLGAPGGRWRLLGLLALPLMAARSLVGLYPSTHDLLHDGYNHAQYGWLFLLGLLAARSELWALAQRHRHAALALAAASWLLIQLYFHHYENQPPPTALRWAQRGLFGAMQWWCLVAACGYARQHLDRDSPWRQRLGAAVFCVYILHQTLIVLFARALLPLQLPAALEGPLLIALTAAACALAYLALRRVPLLRGLVGIARPPMPPGRQPDAAGRTMAP